MGMIFKPSWWLQMFLSTLLTMFFIWIIKKVSIKYNVPVVSTMATEV